MSRSRGRTAAACAPDATAATNTANTVARTTPRLCIAVHLGQGGFPFQGTWPRIISDRSPTTEGEQTLFEIHETATSKAAPEQVFALLADVTTWTRWAG